MNRTLDDSSGDRYVVTDYLTEGGMGAIYRGKKLGAVGFEKHVIIKQLLPEFTDDPKFIRMFLREARISAGLNHANIVRTVDLVRAGKEFYIVMEYVRGADLQTLLRRAKRRGKKFHPGAGLFIAHEILEALHYAHTLRGADGVIAPLVHRDISPSNILISRDGEVKLTDFGIAKASSLHTQLSAIFQIQGKFGYVSPEQSRNESVDERSDLYSLAVVLFEVLTQERLFVRDSAAHFYQQSIRRPSSINPDLPVALDAVMLRALAASPADRYPSAHALQDALGEIVRQEKMMWSTKEMALHLADVCGGDETEWFVVQGKAQTKTSSPGTAVIALEEEQPVEADTSDSESYFWEKAHATGAQTFAMLKDKELTSIIALDTQDIEIVDRAKKPAKAAGGDSTIPIALSDSSVIVLEEPTAKPAEDPLLAESRGRSTKNATESWRQRKVHQIPQAKEKSAPRRVVARTSVDWLRHIARGRQKMARGMGTIVNWLVAVAAETKDFAQRFLTKRRIFKILFVLFLLSLGLTVAYFVAFSGNPGEEPGNEDSRREVRSIDLRV